MNNYQFISYEKTPNDDLQLGVATILVNDFIYRYRHMQKKDGSSTYFASASISIKDAQGNRKYLDGIEMDSRSKQELLMSFLRKNVSAAIEETRPSMPASVFTPIASNATLIKCEEDQGVPF